MRTLLVLAEHPDFAESVRSAVNAEQYRVVHRANLEEAEPLLVHGLAEACILDVELANVQGIWLFEKLRRRAPKCPTIIYTGGQWGMGRRSLSARRHACVEQAGPAEN